MWLQEQSGRKGGRGRLGVGTLPGQPPWWGAPPPLWVSAWSSNSQRPDQPSCHWVLVSSSTDALASPAPPLCTPQCYELYISRLTSPRQLMDEGDGVRRSRAGTSRVRSQSLPEWDGPLARGDLGWPPSSPTDLSLLGLLPSHWDPGGLPGSHCRPWLWPFYMGG